VLLREHSMDYGEGGIHHFGKYSQPLSKVFRLELWISRDQYDLGKRNVSDNQWEQNMICLLQLFSQ
jgi:hypothetical protein